MVHNCLFSFFFNLFFFIFFLILNLYCSFILYRPQAHLNNKHTVFGSLVGGMETLDKMEQVPTGENDKPNVISLFFFFLIFNLFLIVFSRRRLRLLVQLFLKIHFKRLKIIKQLNQF